MGYVSKSTSPRALKTLMQMAKMGSRILCVSAFVLTTHAAQTVFSSPTIVLDNGTFIGTHNATTNTNRYLGIPFAQPPIGELRFNLPVANSPYEGTHDATSFGPSCFAQNFSLTLPSNMSLPMLELLEQIGNTSNPLSEDCLSVNVVQPAGLSQDMLNAKLPVLVWIYGGGFETGASAVYPGDPIVSYATQLGKPIIYVSLNYRLSVFGWLASQEVKDAGIGNLGLRDQRLALKWVQKYISAFGGDPTKVTIWGESAGAISIAYQLIANNGDNEGLFRGAIMDSGSTIPRADITQGQQYFDLLVQGTGCAESSDALACLRSASLDSILATVSTFPTLVSGQSLNTIYSPGVDGGIITESVQSLLGSGKVANVPIINGDDDDEGTLFTMALQNITTSEELHDYLSTFYLPSANSSQIDRILTLYPQDYSAGSPFDTGLLNALTPQFKRLAAIQGDLVFQGPRRLLLAHVSGRQASWSFLSKNLKSDPILGSCHSSELIGAFFSDGPLMKYFINFVHDLNPNDLTVALPTWPAYTTASPQLLTLQDNADEPVIITQDTFREEGIAYLTELVLQFPL